MQVENNWVSDLCSYIREQSTTGESLQLGKLAERAGLSPFHLQRKFKAAIGLTPKQFVEACRIEAFKNHLRSHKSVTEATYDAGFGSSRGVYERTDAHLGMTPSAYRQRGQNMAISYACEQTAFGLLMLAATDRGLCFVQLGESEQELTGNLRKEFSAAELVRLNKPFPEQFNLWIEALNRYLAGQSTSLEELPLDVRGTAFQWRVWRFLQTIPAGAVRSYAEVAEAIGKPGAARAVGHACATNPVALVVPCHRVLRGDGQLGGYRWGLQRKRKLLEHERAVNVRK
ncbi:MAG TPA: methylated-DNA--[protein]-cysteine S-methyltransferase [Bryobacteraceae bacterium]|jgi:AraC family transcriptional regulator of adaptative response/methylated-DNA-[protein]-cysteine methyltransferase|nr:methylated-DNA--[protein]-cysteine S-methyltransferase [Bryobacteraceae bacterium]